MTRDIRSTHRASIDPRQWLPVVGAVLALSCIFSGSPSKAQQDPEFLGGTVDGLSVTVIRDRRGDSGERRRLAVLDRPWLYCSPLNNSLYVVPAGYVTDFASIPGFAKAFITQFGDWAEASVIHDWLYDVGQPDHRKEADQIFREAIREQSTSGFDRTVMYWAVRLGGGGAYAKARTHDWRDNFVDRQGVTLPQPPIARPTDPVWKRDFDCRELDVPVRVRELLSEYESEHAVSLQLR